MTTNSLYLIICVAASLTLLAFTQKNTDHALAQASSTSATHSIMNERPAMTSTVNPSTTSSTDNSTTSTTSSTSTDYPVRPTVTHTEVAQPGTTNGSTTTTDIPTTGSTYSNPN